MNAPNPLTPVNSPDPVNNGSSPVAGVAAGLSPQQMQDLLLQMQAKLDALEGGKREPEDTTERTYFHRVPNSTFIVTRKGPNGENFPEQHTFHGGKLTTNDPVLNAFLLPLTKMMGSPVFLNEPPEDKDKKIAMASVIESAQKSIDRMGAEARPK